MKSSVTYHLSADELANILREHFNRTREEKIEKAYISASAATDYLDRPTGGHYFTFTGEMGVKP